MVKITPQNFVVNKFSKSNTKKIVAILDFINFNAGNDSIRIFASIKSSKLLPTQLHNSIGPSAAILLIIFSIKSTQWQSLKYTKFA